MGLAIDQYKLIGQLPRKQRKHEVRKLYEALRPMGYSYAGVAELVGITRNQVAADIRDSAPDKIKVIDTRDSFFISSPPPPLKRVEPPRIQWNAAIYDIETTSFTAEGFDGFIICACFLDTATGELFTPHITIDENHGDDKRVLSEIFDLMGTYRILIGHNVASFDYNMLLSRAIYHRMPPPPFHHYIDTYQQSRMLAVRTRKSLGNLTDWLCLEGQKTSIQKTSWSNIRSKDPVEFSIAIGDIIHHCQLDVIANQRVLDAIYPYLISRHNGTGGIIKDAKLSYVGW
jgi:hypothetical protein